MTNLKWIKASSCTSTSQVLRLTCSWKWVGIPVPLWAGIFSFRPSSTKKCKSDMGNGVLIGFVNISAKLMPNHKFFYSLVTALALDFFPPPDCNFWQRQVFHLDFSFFQRSDLSPAANSYFFSHSCANSQSEKHQLDHQYSQFEKDHLAYGWELCSIEFRRHLRLC